VSETKANPKKSGKGRSIVYIVVTVVILVIAYIAVNSYQARQTTLPEPTSEESVQATEAAPEPAPSGSDPETTAPQDLETQRQDVLSPEFNPFEF